MKNMILLNDRKINSSGIIDLVKGILDPLMTISLALIPLAGLVAALITAVFWYFKDDEEKERKPVGRMIKKIGFITATAELLPTLWTLFGLMN